MNVINGLILVTLVLIGAGCSISGQNAEVFVAEHAFAKRCETFNNKCEMPKLGWKGASGNDFVISR